MKSRISLSKRVVAGLVELAGLLLAGMLLAGCDAEPLAEGPEATLRVQLDLEAFAPAGLLRAGDCLTIMDSVILRIDGVQRGRLSLTPSDTLQVSFPDVVLGLGAEIEAEVVSNNGTTLFRNSVVYGGQPQVELAVVPQAPVLWVCPAALSVEAVGTFQVLNQGDGTLAWTLAPPPELGVVPALGRVGAAGTMRVQVTRQAGGAASLTLRVESDQGTVALPVQLGENGPPVLVAPLPDLALAPDETSTVSLPTRFEDPDNDPLTFAASSDNPGVATASVSGTLLTVEAVAEGTAEITVSAADPFHAPVEARFQVIVDQNDPPLLVVPFPDLALTPGDVVFIGTPLFFDDPEDDPLTFTATSDNLSVAQVSLDSEGILRVEAVDNGEATVTVTAADPFNPPTEDSFLVTVEDALPDLVIVPRDNIPANDPEAYCRRANDVLEVVVGNAGPGPVADAFNLAVEFSPGGQQVRRVNPPLAAATAQSVFFEMPVLCTTQDCNFVIFADFNGEVEEANETNNQTDGFCPEP